MKLNKNQTVEGDITRIVEEASFVNVGAGGDVVIPKMYLDQVKGDPFLRIESQRKRISLSLKEVDELQGG